MGKEMSDTSTKDMDEIIDASLLFFKDNGQDNNPIRLLLSTTQRRVADDVLGYEAWDEERYAMRGDKDIRKVFGDADYLHEVRLGTGSKDSPFGVFAKVRYLLFFSNGINKCTGPLSDVQVSALVEMLGLRTDRQTVEGMSDEELLKDYLTKKLSHVRHELQEIDEKLQFVRYECGNIDRITLFDMTDKKYLCLDAISTDVWNAKVLVYYALGRVKDMINYVEEDDVYVGEDDDD